MKFREIKKLDLEAYYWRILYGKSLLRANFNEIRAGQFKDFPNPVFFLSTGRCGTNWFAHLLSADKSLKVFHEPKPNLGIQAKTAYEIYTNANFNITPNETKLMDEIVLAGREQFFRYSYKTRRRYVETNNHITFLAPAILNIFPNARFVHLNRHPGDFVRSALRRNFYNNIDDIKRITPLTESTHSKEWNTYSQLKKNAWLWTETNHFIESFKRICSPKNFFYFDFSELNEENVIQLTKFLETDISKEWISKLLERPVNVQTAGKIEKYDDWEKKDREDLKRICNDLSQKYNYNL